MAVVRRPTRHKSVNNNNNNKRGGKRKHRRMTSTEKQLYDLLIEIKEDQAALSAMLKADRWVHDEHMRRIVNLEERVDTNIKIITTLNASLKAWWAASAALGSILGWLLGHLTWLGWK